MIVDAKRDVQDKNAIVAAAACTLAARRDSASDAGAAAASVATADAQDGELKADATAEDDAEAARRRSSVLQRIPDNVRAVVGIGASRMRIFLSHNTSGVVGATNVCTATRFGSGWDCFSFKICR